MTEYLSAKEVGERVSVLTPDRLAQLRFTGRGPKFLKPSPKQVIYRWSDVEEWLDGTERTSTRESA